MARAVYSTCIVKQLQSCPKRGHKFFKKNLVNNQSNRPVLLYSQHIHQIEGLNFNSSSIESAKAISKNTAVINSTIKKAGLKKSTKDKASITKYKCPHCNFLGSEKDSVKRHIKKEHNLDPFSCPHCMEGFTNFKTLNKHITNNHPSENRLKEPYEQILGEANTNINNSGSSLQPKCGQNDTQKHTLKSVASKTHYENSIKLEDEQNFVSSSQSSEASNVTQGNYILCYIYSVLV